MMRFFWNADDAAGAPAAFQRNNSKPWSTKSATVEEIGSTKRRKKLPRLEHEWIVWISAVNGKVKHEVADQIKLGIAP
jgi:hypothetical protein